MRCSLYIYIYVCVCVCDDALKKSLTVAATPMVASALSRWSWHVNGELSGVLDN